MSPTRLPLAGTVLPLAWATAPPSLTPAESFRLIVTAAAVVLIGLLGIAALLVLVFLWLERWLAGGDDMRDA